MFKMILSEIIFQIIIIIIQKVENYSATSSTDATKLKLYQILIFLI